jgi:hypothetical protein
LTSPSTSWKEATDTTAGDATKFGAPDGLNKNNQLFNGDLNIDNVDVNSPWFFRTQKCYFLNNAGTYGFLIDSSASIVADRTITLPLLTGNDTMVLQSHIQTISSKKLGNWLDAVEIAAPSSPATSEHRLYFDSTSNKLSTKNNAGTVAEYTTNSGSQTLTNKTLTTPTINVLDNAFNLKDNADNTKIAVFQLSGITTGTTRTITIPNSSFTMGTLSNVSEDTSPTLGGLLAGGGFDQTGMGTISMTEQAAANADVAGDGQVWIKTATPNELWFTDDAGTDFQVASKTGTHAALETFAIAASDNTTALATGTVFTFYMPYAMTLTDIKASVLTAPTGAELIVDVHDAGTTIMSTDKLDIEVSEFHTKDATTQPALTDTALANNAKIEIIIDQVGSSVAGAGLVIYLIGYKP